MPYERKTLKNYTYFLLLFQQTLYLKKNVRSASSDKK